MTSSIKTYKILKVVYLLTNFSSLFIFNKFVCMRAYLALAVWLWQWRFWQWQLWQCGSDSMALTVQLWQYGSDGTALTVVALTVQLWQ